MIYKSLTTLITLGVTAAVLYLSSHSANRKINPKLLEKLQINILKKTPQLLTLNTGQGSCHLLLCPSSNFKMVIFDCGSLPKLVRHRTHKERFRYLISELKPKKLEIIISHADEDHYNLLNDLPQVDEIPTKIYVEPHQQNDQIRSIKGKIADYIPSQIQNCGNATYKILRQPIRHHRNNKNSLMLLIQTKNGKTGLLTADITGSEEKHWLPYLKVYAPLEFLSASHHGSISHQSNHTNWAKNLKARKLIISSARVQNWLHPRCEAIQNYLPYLFQSELKQTYHCGSFKTGYKLFHTNKSVFTTHDNGDILIELKKSSTISYQY